MSIFQPLIRRTSEASRQHQGVEHGKPTHNTSNAQANRAGYRNRSRNRSFALELRSICDPAIQLRWHRRSGRHRAPALSGAYGVASSATGHLGSSPVFSVLPANVAILAGAPGGSQSCRSMTVQGTFVRNRFRSSSFALPSKKSKER